MTGYLIRRLLALLPVLLIVATAGFFLIYLTPGDPGGTGLNGPMPGRPPHRANVEPSSGAANGGEIPPRPAKHQQAYCQPTYETAHAELHHPHDELRRLNEDAVHSLTEGLEETLMLRRVGGGRLG